MAVYDALLRTQREKACMHGEGSYSKKGESATERAERSSEGTQQEIRIRKQTKERLRET